MFSGGGSLGAVQVGMLRALVEAGIRPDYIVGCSVGAINGAGFAAEPTLRGVARLERIWRRIAAGDPDIMPGGLMPVAVQLARKGESLHDPKTLETLIEQELPARDFAELQVPFECVATDLQTAAEYWFDAGPLIPALMASASLPAVYPARELNGRLLIDGGVLNEVHTERAAEWGATELYVLHVGHLDDRPTDVQRPFDSAMRAYWTARRFRLEETLRQVPSHCTLHRLPSGQTPRLRFDDFAQGPELAEIAYAETSEYLMTNRGRGSESAPARRSMTRRTQPAKPLTGSAAAPAEALHRDSVNPGGADENDDADDTTVGTDGELDETGGDEPRSALAEPVESDGKDRADSQ